MTLPTRSRALIISLFILALFVPARAHAQQRASSAIRVASAGELQELVLRDGTRAIGRIERIDGSRLTFRTDAGAVIDVDIAQVLSADIAEGQIVKGDYWPGDANPTRLFFAPTGRSLKRGESYFGLYEVWAPFVQYGVTDRLTIGGGTPLFIGSGEHPFWFTPKFQVLARPNTQVSVGAMHFLNVADATFGVAYGAITQGSTDNAATVGIGWAYSRGEDSRGHSSKGDSAVLMLGGEHRLSRRAKLVTENYFFDGHGIISGGFRLMGERLSVDIGLASPLAADGFIAFPMVNFVWKSGR
jgi:hypothetical protein